ncbi:phosphoethanolamine transferase domain-containing protein [Shigella flexneri]
MRTLFDGKHRDVEAPTKKTLFEFTCLAIVGRFLYLYLPEYCLFKRRRRRCRWIRCITYLVFLVDAVVAFSVINIVLTLSSFLWLNRPLACLFILVGAAAQYFIMSYRIVIDR